MSNNKKIQEGETFLISEEIELDNLDTDSLLDDNEDDLDAFSHDKTDVLESDMFLEINLLDERKKVIAKLVDFNYEEKSYGGGRIRLNAKLLLKEFVKLDTGERNACSSINLVSGNIKANILKRKGFVLKASLLEVESVNHVQADELFVKFTITNTYLNT